ncbi:DNA gyrase inhibitor YacG [Ottowia sp.]|uniref:DNA gyrase inhibitor YacG n=1 Tax=Ottowia sp. TaxID=1898956 RepID=UPI002C82D35C|nr:DNA gyrase inhibitor YacG [Ottowia sp.]HOB66405.1 DNA gyrase inhibitor YacG [Ottowia sp.]HPZ58289.1 DNA gyrase inhibitor YacG [Ottowia sp.]HQD48708.1 DNA gyrase inhibitor YacG [Ottowia sp.]
MTDRPAPPAAPARTVRCPACGGPSVFAPQNPYRPFCSERCKLQDLGAWASESFRVEAQEADGAAGDSPPPLQ